MEFGFTPLEAQPIAKAVREYYEAAGLKVAVEQAVSNDAPFRTTLIASKGTRRSLKIIVEAQETLDYHQSLYSFVLWLRANRQNCEMYIAIDENSYCSARTLGELSRDGVGILMMGEAGVYRHAPALNPAYTVTISPDLRLGNYKTKVTDVVYKFNSGQRKDAHRDMCELVEGATRSLLKKAIARGWIVHNADEVFKISWSDCINFLASHQKYTSGQQPLLDDALKTDLHSFRNSRNLADHPQPDSKQSRQLTLQFVERIMQGPRLLEQITSASRKIK